MFQLYSSPNLVTTQNSFWTLPLPQNEPIRAPKSKKIVPTLSQNQKLDLKEAWKMKIVDPTIYLNSNQPQKLPENGQKGSEWPKN